MIDSATRNRVQESTVHTELSDGIDVELDVGPNERGTNKSGHEQQQRTVSVASQPGEKLRDDQTAVVWS